MTKAELKALVNGLIALAQAYEILPENIDKLADELQVLASHEMYIAKEDLIAWLEG